MHGVIFGWIELHLPCILPLAKLLKVFVKYDIGAKLVMWFECRFLDTEVEPRHQYVVSFSKSIYPHCFCRLRCEMSTRLGHPCEEIRDKGIALCYL